MKSAAKPARIRPALDFDFGVGATAAALSSVDWAIGSGGVFIAATVAGAAYAGEGAC